MFDRTNLSFFLINSHLSTVVTIFECFFPSFHQKNNQISLRLGDFRLLSFDPTPLSRFSPYNFKCRFDFFPRLSCPTTSTLCVIGTFWHSLIHPELVFDKKSVWVECLVFFFNSIFFLFIFVQSAQTVPVRKSCPRVVPNTFHTCRTRRHSSFQAFPTWL